ncbi:uncharacterized protein LOC143281448 [Babylonia areolata]|uniref:uncharacterized protein LOC143281448 n=1 Tax=Babylonia areolata TaxID=304850 RepID=UPI003FCFC710
MSSNTPNKTNAPGQPPKPPNQAAGDEADSAQNQANMSGGLLPNPDVKQKVPPAKSKSPKKGRKGKKGKQQQNQQANEEAEKLAQAIENNLELPQITPSTTYPNPATTTTTSTTTTVESRTLMAEAEAMVYDHEAVNIAFQLVKRVLPQAVTVQDPPRIGPYPTLGVTDQGRKLAQKRLFPKLINLEYVEVMRLMERLWAEPERDYQYLVLDLLKHATVTILRSSGHKDLFNLIRGFITSKPMRDTVDELATKHLTTLAYLEPAETWPRMDVWVNDPMPWVQRAAILHQHGMGDFTDRVRLFRFCKQHLHNPPEVADILEDAIEEALGRFAITYHTFRVPCGIEYVVGFITTNLTSMSPGLKKRLLELKAKLEPMIPQRNAAAISEGATVESAEGVGEP